MTETYKQQATRHVRTAEHLLRTTYPLLQDPKLLLGVLHNLYDAQKLALDHLLSEIGHDPHHYASAESKMRILQFQSKDCMPASRIRLITDTRQLVERHHGAPVEFRRKGTYVMCSDAYEMTTLSEENLDSILQKTKEMVK
ncbi:MAG: hypothetical protein ACOCWQ_01490 [Nanoarchaeota archaeon]